jgi:GNAT superfamily N-acetyltransferase
MSQVTTYYLEMTSVSLLKAKPVPEGLRIEECLIKQYEYNRFMYQLVGGQWQWNDKLSWSDEKWKEYAENDNLRTFAAYYQGSPAGYYELQRQKDGDVEIVYFGLAEKFVGRGFGGGLLSHAIETAWDWQGTKRVWVHTCTLDHPAALENYKARGMKLYRKTTEEKK